MTLRGKFVAITGAAGGIGQALCRLFGGEGARIGAIDRSPAVRDFSAELAGEGIFAAAEVVDVGDPTLVAKAFERLIGAQGQVDVLVNNAGFSKHPTFAQTDPAGWRDDVNGNLNGAATTAPTRFSPACAIGGRASSSMLDRSTASPLLAIRLTAQPRRE